MNDERPPFGGVADTVWDIFHCECEFHIPQRRAQPSLPDPQLPQTRSTPMTGKARPISMPAPRRVTCFWGAKERTMTGVVHRWVCLCPGQPDTCPHQPEAHPTPRTQS